MSALLTFAVCVLCFAQVRAIATDVLCSGIKTAGPAQVRPLRQCLEPTRPALTSPCGGTSTQVFWGRAEWVASHTGLRQKHTVLTECEQYLSHVCCIDSHDGPPLSCPAQLPRDNRAGDNTPTVNHFTDKYT